MALLLVPKQVPAAAVTIYYTVVSNLICFCSIATVVCIWYIAFLYTPKLFGVSCRRNCFFGDLVVLATLI